MKKNILSFLLLLFAIAVTRAQSPVDFVIAPPVVCYSGPGNTYAYATITQTMGASSYSWGIASSNASCTPSFTAGANGYSISISFNCCGIYTVTTYPSNGGSVSHTVNVVCTSPVSIVASSGAICPGGSATLTASGAGSYNWSNGATGASIVVSPTATSCYTVTGITGSCSAYASACVSVQPSSIIVSGPNSICAGNNATLTASGSSNYTWQPGGLTGASIVVSPTATTCYTVTGSTGGSCPASPAVKCLSVSPSPNLVVFGGFFCAGNTGTLVASGASTYTWLPFNQTGNVLTITPFANGCYTLVGSSAAGCTNAIAGCYSVSPSPTITISGNLSACPGETVILTASGASSYNWSNGATGASIAITPTATSCYTVSGSNGTCTGFASRCVTVQPANIIVSGPNSICAGSNATLTASGSSNYTWQPGGFTGASIVVSPTATTCYTVTGSTGGSCPASPAVKCVSVGSGPTPTITTSSPLFCSGVAGTLTASGASSYTWYPFNLTGSSIVITPSVGMCYTVVGTNSFACSTGSAINCFSVMPSPNVTIGASNSVVCPGGIVTFTAFGANNYTWQPGGSNAAAILVTPSVSTCYTLIGNSYGCTGTAVRCVTVQPANIVVSGPNSICAGSNATLIASGSSNYTWQPGGLPGASIVVSPTATTCYTVTGSTGGSCPASPAVKCLSVSPSPNLVVFGGFFCAGNTGTLVASGASTYTWLPFNQTGNVLTITPFANGCYTLIGTSAAGCTNAIAGCYSVSPSPTITISGNLSACPGETVILTASGASSYNWSNGATGASIAITPTATSCYTVSGSNGTCTGFASRCVTVQPANIVVSGPNSICAGSNATLTASGSSNYTWQPGGFTGASIVVSPTVTTCYTVTGSNAGSCPASPAVKCVSVGSGSTPTITSSGGTFCAGNSGTLSATGALSYTWYPFNLTGSSIVITPSVGMCYTVVGTNTFGCTGSAINCFSVLPTPSVTITGNSPICSGSSATLTATGANTYTWSNGATGASIVVSPTATSCYSVVGTSYGCTGSAVSCLTVQPSNIIISGPNSVCTGGNASLTASGSSNYTWQPGGFTGASIVVSPTASTCYTVTGSGGSCPALPAVRCITVQASPLVSVIGSTALCSGGSAILIANGASTYTWLPGNLTGSFVSVTPSVSTCYTVVGTAANGCVGLGVSCVTVGTSPTITVSGGVAFCSGSTQTLTASGASSYTWQPSNQTGSSIVITPSVGMCYTVTGSNSGCTSSALTCFSVLPAPAVSISGNTFVCAGSSATLTASGASSFTWSNGSTGASIVVSPTATTCYTVQGSNPGCSSVGAASRCVMVFAGPVVAISGNSVTCAGSSLTLTASGAGSYTWSNGATGSSIVLTPTASTCYSVVGSNGGGCTGMAVKCFTVISSLSLTTSGNQTICRGALATISASGAATYSWSNGSTSNAIFVSPAASTIYTVTGNTGNCSQTTTVAVFVNPSPTLIATASPYLICAGDSSTLTATGAVTYTWNNTTTSPAIVVSPSVSTVYTVTGTNALGCTSTATLVVGVSPCTGIDASAQKAGRISVYPNPATNYLTLQSEAAGNVNYVVCDMLGRQIVKGDFEGTKDLDLSAYANGTYMIRFDSALGTTYKKLVIDK